jgi:hypothetical protein
MTSIHHNTTRHPRIHLPVRRSLEMAVTAVTAAGIAVVTTLALTGGASQGPPAVVAASPPAAVVTEQFEELERGVFERATAALLAASQNAQVVATEIERFEAEVGESTPVVGQTNDQTGSDELERYVTELAAAAQLAASQNAQVIAAEIERFEAEAGGSPSVSDATTGRTFEELERYVTELAAAAQLAASRNAQVIAAEIERFEAEAGGRAPGVSPTDAQTRFERYMASR